MSVLAHSLLPRTGYLEGALQCFTEASIALSNEIPVAIATNHTSTENVARIINDKLMSIERAFIHDEGLPGRPYFK